MHTPSRLEQENHIGSRLFETTQWEVVSSVHDPDPARAQKALEWLCRTYWFPLYTYLRRHAFCPEDAEDYIQGFFADLLERRALMSADPARGRFRCFLLSCLRHFVAGQKQRAGRFKRGGGCQTVSLDVAWAEQRYHSEVGTDDPPEAAFDRQWALTSIRTVLEVLEAEAAAHGKSALFKRLQNTLAGSTPTTSYAELARIMGISEGGVKMAAHRLRQRFRELFRQQIARTVDRPEDLDDEILYLYRILSR